MSAHDAPLLGLLAGADVTSAAGGAAAVGAHGDAGEAGGAGGEGGHAQVRGFFSFKHF